MDFAGFGNLIFEHTQSAINEAILEDTGEVMMHVKNVGQVVDFYKKVRHPVGAAHVPGDERLEVKQTVASKLVLGSAPRLSKIIFNKIFDVAGTKPGEGFNLPLTSLPPIKVNVIFYLTVGGVQLDASSLKLSFQIDPAVEFKGVAVGTASGVREVNVKSLTAELKIFYLLPMMLGMKKQKITEGGFKIVKDIHLLSLRS